MALHTRLTALLDIEHPVMLAGMGGVSYHRLVAAVSEAGGIGTLGASTMGEEELPVSLFPATMPSILQLAYQMMSALMRFQYL